MSGDNLFIYFLKGIFLPPGFNLILLFLGLWGLNKWRKKSVAIISISAISLLLFSLPWFSNIIVETLEPKGSINASSFKQLAADSEQLTAIVVLSNGRRSLAPEYGEIDTVSESTLMRLQYAAWLYKKTQLPILLASGNGLNEATSEAVLMNDALLSNFNVAPKWIEAQSTNTLQSAQYSQTILQQNNISQIILITHAWHFKRAQLAFEKFGIKVIAAPVAFMSRAKSQSEYNFLPNSHALQNSTLALSELINLLWYRLRY